MDIPTVLSMVVSIAALGAVLYMFIRPPPYIQWVGDLNDPKAREAAIAGMVDVAVERLEARIAAHMDVLKADIPPLATAFADRLVVGLQATTDHVVDRMGDRLEQAIAGSVAGGLGGILDNYLQAKTAEKATDASERGVTRKALKGFKGAAARELASELDPTGGAIANRLLDLAEANGVDPDEALAWGLDMWDRYGERIMTMAQNHKGKRPPNASPSRPGPGHKGSDVTWG